METAFDVTFFCRKSLDGYFEKYTLDQLNKIPEGFSNNLIWNIAHVIVTQQLIVNKLAGLPVMVSDEMIQSYMRGTRPNGPVSQTQAEEIRALLFPTVERTKGNILAGQSKGFSTYTTSTGYTIGSLAEAVQFNNYHEATHLGIMMGIRRFV